MSQHYDHTHHTANQYIYANSAGYLVEVIDGMIYDRLTEPGKPIVGAPISYDVLHSLFVELQEGKPNKAN